MRQISTLEPTRYEITASHPGGSCFLVAYTPRLSRHGLLAAMRGRGDAIVARCLSATPDDDTITWSTKPRPNATMNGWTIGFTGRTQRDCRTNGEHPDIAARLAA